MGTAGTGNIRMGTEGIGGARVREMTTTTLTVLLLLLASLGGGSAQQPLQLSQVCHPPGSASVWFEAASGNLIACAGAIESNGTQALYVPDIGAPIIVVMPPGVGAGINASTSSPRCLFATDSGSKDLVPIILQTYTAEGGIRHALLCPVPALSDSSFPGGGGGPPPQWVNLYSKLDNALPFYPIDGLALWFFGLTAPPVPTVTWAAGGALITLRGFNLAVPGAGGSGGEGGGGGTAAASAALTSASVGMTCRFYLAPNSSATSYTAPWHLLLATSGVQPLGSSGRDSLALSATRTSVICQLPPMPRGFIPKQGSVYVSVSPDPYSISFCLPRNLSLFTPVATSTSVARSSQEGGFLLTVVGHGFPPGGLLSSTPRVSFGSTAVVAAIVAETALACTVPAHVPGEVALSLSFDGQTFARGNAFTCPLIHCLCVPRRLQCPPPNPHCVVHGSIGSW